MTELTCFKAYDIRGKLGYELNNDIAYRIGRAFVEQMQLKKVVVGADVRESSASLKQALMRGIIDAGADVIDLGTTGTEEIYFATFYLEHKGVDGGVEITASHNPIEYNGMKLVSKGARAITRDTGLTSIQKLAELNKFKTISSKAGQAISLNLSKEYLEYILSFICLQNLRQMKIVVNPGNGAAGPIIDMLENVFEVNGVPIEFIKIHHTPDSTFPNGIPNPLLPENRLDTSQAVIENNADMGVAWDGDFDRCFLFDENGDFIEGYYTIGLLAQLFLQKESGGRIIHDARLVWNTIETVKKNGGIPIESKAGHVFIKQKMREEDAIYGGEMSGHHYFRDFGYCDSGMIPWLLVAELMSERKSTLSALTSKMKKSYPTLGEINFAVDVPNEVMEHVFQHYRKHAQFINKTDGFSLDFGRWRFNLRLSNTESVVRLNLETDGDPALMEKKYKELSELICKKSTISSP